MNTFWYLLCKQTQKIEHTTLSQQINIKQHKREPKIIFCLSFLPEYQIYSRIDVKQEFAGLFGFKKSLQAMRLNVSLHRAHIFWSTLYSKISQTPNLFTILFYSFPIFKPATMYARSFQRLFSFIRETKEAWTAIILVDLRSQILSLADKRAQQRSQLKTTLSFIHNGNSGFAALRAARHCCRQKLKRNNHLSLHLCLEKFKKSLQFPIDSLDRRLPGKLH